MNRTTPHNEGFWAGWLSSSAVHLLLLCLAALTLAPRVMKRHHPNTPGLELTLADEEDEANSLNATEREVDFEAVEQDTSAAASVSPQGVVEESSSESQSSLSEATQKTMIQEQVPDERIPEKRNEDSSKPASEVATDSPALRAFRAELAAAAGQPTADTSPGERSAGLGQAVDKIGRGRVKLFGVEGEGTRFAYVLDRSDSMTGTPLQAVKVQLSASLRSLDRVHQFHLIFFNHHLLEWRGNRPGGRHTFATEDNLRDVIRFANGMTAHGGTYRLTALNRALAVRPDALFFLTDADNPMPRYEVDRAIGQATRQATAINTIEFGIGPRPKRDNFLKRLASETDGQYDYVDVRQLGR